jgi:hypothetical protein
MGVVVLAVLLVVRDVIIIAPGHAVGIAILGVVGVKGLVIINVIMPARLRAELMS